MAVAKKPARNTQKSKRRKGDTGSEGLPRWWKAYFAAIAENGGFKGKAAEACKIARDTPVKYLEDNPHLAARFAAAMTEALDQAAENLMAEAVRRGVHGVDEPVFYKGEEVAAVTKYSDTLLMFTLNARGKGTRQTTYTLDLSKLSDDQLRRLADGEDPVSVVAAK